VYVQCRVKRLSYLAVDACWLSSGPLTPRLPRVLQGCTTRFLAHLVQGCAVEGPPLIKGTLALALELDRRAMDPQALLLAVPLARRLAEAADAGHF
jgi:hypothetical protein